MMKKMYNFHQNQHLIHYGCEKTWFYIDFILIFIDFHWFSIDFHWFSLIFPLKIISKSVQRPRNTGGRAARGVGWPKISSEWCSRPTFDLNLQVWKKFRFGPLGPAATSRGPACSRGPRIYELRAATMAKLFRRVKSVPKILHNWPKNCKKWPKITFCLTL